MKTQVMHARTLLSLALMAAPLLALAEGNSPWLPIPGQISASIGYVTQKADEAYIGTTKLAVSAITGGAATKYDRSSTKLRVDYGLTDSVALDAALSFGSTSVGGADKDSGATDSVIGLRWRVLDEYEQPSMPTVTLRGAAIIKGSYQGARLAALGKAANGFEASIIVGKELTPAIAAYGELGLLSYSNNVPNATFYEIGTRIRVAPGWSTSVAYTNKKFAGDLDIGGPGFTPARFQQVREERSLVKLGVNFAFAANQGVALSYAMVTNGRNTVKDNSILGISYTYGF